MICIKTEIPQAICDIDDQLKATYHKKNWFVFGLSKRGMIEADLWKKL
jgi:hypothetical protein